MGEMMKAGFLVGPQNIQIKQIPAPKMEPGMIEKKSQLVESVEVIFTCGNQEKAGVSKNPIL